jgi:hypothetical protein
MGSKNFLLFLSPILMAPTLISTDKGSLCVQSVGYYLCGIIETGHTQREKEAAASLLIEKKLLFNIRMLEKKGRARRSYSTAPGTRGR